MKKTKKKQERGLKMTLEMGKEIVENLKKHHEEKTTPYEFKNQKTEQEKMFEKAIKISQIIGQDKDEARKIIDMLIASYGIPRGYFS